MTNNHKQALEDLQILLDSPIPVKSIREKLLTKAIEILTKLSEIENKNLNSGIKTGYSGYGI